jgi:translation elongation factor EF-1beta
LAKIKEKVNTKTQEEYYSKNKLQTEPNEFGLQRIIVTGTAEY